MGTRAIRHTLIAAVTCMLATASGTRAFLVQTYEGDDGPVRLHWASDDVPFVLNGAGSDDMDPDTTFAIIRQAFDVWERVETSRLRFVDGGVDNAATANRRDRRNVIVFDETGRTLAAPEGSGVIAITRINSDVTTGRIVDADIIYNGRDFRFAVDAQGGEIELLDVTVHEIGHFVGLNHTPIVSSGRLQPTMNPFYSGDPGEASSLAADDIAGISHLYPTPAHLAASGTISGTVSDATGAPLFGAHVVAQAADGSLISTLSGAETGSEAPGVFTIRSLPAGEYTVRIEPFFHGISEDNFGGIFTNLATDIPLEYFDNVSREDLAQTISIDSPSWSVRDVDFTTGFAQPGFPLVTPVQEPANTPDTQGPYEVALRASSVTRVELRVEITLADGETRDLTMPMAEDDQGVHVGLIPGQPAGSSIRYRVIDSSDENRVTHFPGESTWLGFDVVTLTGEPLAIAVVRSAGAVRIFDTGSDEEISRVAVGQDPIQALSSIDGSAVFIADLAANEIIVLDRETFTVVDRIAVAAAPLDMTLSIDGGTLYVTNSDAGRLSAIDVETHSVVGSWIVGQSLAGPYGIAAGISGRVYVTDLNAGELIVFEEGRVTSRLAGPSSPRALTATPDGSAIFVTSFNSGVLARIDDATGTVSGIDLGVLGTFAALAHPTLDRLYLTAHQDDLVLIVETSTGRLIDQVGVGNDPRGLSLSPDGERLFVTSATSDEIHILDAASGDVIGIYTAAGGPRGIVVVDAPQVRQTVVSSGPQPSAWSLSPLYPNPFNPEAQLRVTVGTEPGPARLDVYNMLGQRVRTLIEGADLPAGGSLAITWDGRDAAGARVASGVYLFVLETPTLRQVRKGLLLR